MPGGPAETAGVRSMRGGRLGDVVVAMDGKRVGSTDEVFSFLEQRVPGDRVTLTVQRPAQNVDSDGYEDVNLQVTLGNTEKVG